MEHFKVKVKKDSKNFKVYSKCRLAHAECKLNIN